MKFKQKNGSLSIVLEEEQLKVMVECIAKAARKETGGILIGYYSSDFQSAIITEVTSAPQDSSSGPCWFSRG
jgi:pyridoxal/pyridoxine/pyridoxamine kinase